MSSQIGSWNRLESLLNDASSKNHDVTPKVVHKSEEIPHPHLLRCMRHKKSKKGSRYQNSLPRSGEIFTSKDMAGNSLIGAQAKSKNNVAKTYTIIRDTTQPKSNEELDQFSELSEGARDMFLDNFDEDEINEAAKYQKVSSIDMDCLTRGNGISESKKKIILRRNPSIENILHAKKYEKCERVCGIEDAHLRELYRLKCQDLKIGVFGDSEESFLQGTKKKSTEYKLSFLESGFGPKALEKLGQIIRNNFEISQLILRKSLLNGTSIKSFAKNLGQMPSLIHLEIANNSIEPQDFIILFEELTASRTLVSLDFSNYEPDKKNRFTLECLEAFKRFVKGNIYLQYINMTNLMLEDEVVQGILAGLEECPNLISVNLSSNNHSGKALEKVSNVFSQTSIVQLDLSNNKLKKEGALHLARAIQNFKTPGREGLNLILENTQLGADVNHIFAAFGRDTNISKLNLSNNVFYNSGIIRLESALSENIKLMELNLSHCKMGEIGGKILALGLQKNTTLQSLILVNNELGDEIGASIIHAILPNFSLKSLDLSQNKLASESAKALQDLVKKNPNIEKYNLSMNKLNEKEGYLLQEVLYFNSKVIQFNLHHNPVKYNTIETIERITKDNFKKIMFQAVPKLKHEVARRQVFIQDEKHNVADAVELEKIKGDVKRDVDKFQKTLSVLRNREESPTVKKKEKLIMKLGKDIKDHNKEVSEAILRLREFSDEAFLEIETYKNELEGINNTIKLQTKKVEAKQKECDMIKEKYEPEIKKLRMELAKLKENNQFMEMYNDTVLKKIKKEKKKQAAANCAPLPKISDMFLATSELARHKKKPEMQDRTNHESKSRIGIMESQSHLSLIEDPKMSKEYSFAMKNQQIRTSKLLKENERKDPAKRKKNPKNESPEVEAMKSRIKEKIKNLIKTTEQPTGSILGQITDN